MKKTFCIVLVCLVLLLTGCAREQLLDSGNGTNMLPLCSTAETTYVTMVWIPRTGKRYHRNDECSGMKEPREVTIQEAEDMGFTPCKNCYS